MLRLLLAAEAQAGGNSAPSSPSSNHSSSAKSINSPTASLTSFNGATTCVWLCECGGGAANFGGFPYTPPVFSCSSYPHFRAQFFYFPCSFEHQALFVGLTWPLPDSVLLPAHHNRPVPQRTRCLRRQSQAQVLPMESHQSARERLVTTVNPSWTSFSRTCVVQLLVASGSARLALPSFSRTRIF